MKHLFKFILVGAALSCVAFLFVLETDQEVLIESYESKTNQDLPVFNKIKLYTFAEKDIWMMNQSHHGAMAESEKWDRLAIVVDKTTSPKTARFMQLEPGPLVWTPNLKEKEFRVSCFFCHSNGPRVIRPNPNSTQTKLTMKENLKLFLWNLKIKSYGRVQYDSIHNNTDHKRIRPFRLSDNINNDILNLKTCVMCHKEKGLFARGSLKRQQSLTIQFMVDKGIMPPFGISLPNEERKALRDFISGF